MSERNPSLFVSLVAATGLAIAATAGYAGAASKYSHEIAVTEHAAMLVERMAKDAAQIVLHVHADEARVELKKSHDEFAAILKGLQNGDAGLKLDGNYKEKAVQEHLAEVLEIWPTVDKEVKETLASPEPSKDLLERFEEHDEQLYEAVEGLEHAFVEMAHTGEWPSAFADGVAFTEHQATLVQRMAKEYFLIAQGFHDQEMRAELKESLHEFEDNMKYLIEGNMAKQILPAPSPEIEAQLKKVAEMYKPFGAALHAVADDGGKPDKAGLEEVAKDNNKLVEAIEKAAHIYESL